MPNTHGLRQAIIQNLEYHGFEVIDISYNEDDFRYKHLGQKLNNFLHKLVYKNKNYKNKLKFQQLGMEIKGQIEQLQQPADYALMFRADIYPKEILLAVKEKSKKMINYQWDGLYRYPEILPLIPLFDRFFVFDPQDAQTYRDYPLLVSTNFYFDFELPSPIDAQPVDFRFYGTYLRERMPVLEKFLDFVHKNDYSTDIKIYYERPHTNIPTAHFTSEAMPYTQYLHRLQSSKYLLDFNNSAHAGLSFRVFESLKFQKKLIINNKYDIQSYDFYHPNNIFIWDGKDLSGLPAFLETPYQPLAEDILQKYSFGNWISYMLDSPPYQTLDPHK